MDRRRQFSKREIYGKALFTVDTDTAAKLSSQSRSIAAQNQEGFLNETAPSRGLGSDTETKVKLFSVEMISAGNVY